MYSLRLLLSTIAPTITTITTTTTVSVHITTTTITTVIILPVDSWQSGCLFIIHVLGNLTRRIREKGE